MKTILLFSFFLTANLVAFSQDNNTYKQTLTKMMDVSGSQAATKVMIAQMASMLKQQKPDVPVAIWTEFEQTFLKAASENLVNMLVPIYQKQLSEADLKSVIAFYETPIGKKFAEKTPLIMQESMQAGQQWGMKIGQLFADKLKEKGY